MYLGNTYLSEICHPKGKTISRDILHRKPSKHYQTTLSLPHQPRPNTRSWILWEKLLSTFTKSDNITLLHPLGAWSSTHSTSGYWSTYRHNNAIFHREGSSWTKYTKLHSRLSKIATDVNFAPTATTSIPTSIITRPISIAPPRQRL